MINSLEKRCFYKSNKDCILVSYTELLSTNGNKNYNAEKFRKQIIESKAFKKLNKIYYNNKARIIEIGVEERIVPEKNIFKSDVDPYIDGNIYSEGLHFDRLPSDYGRIYIALSEVKPKVGGGTLYLNRLKSIIYAFLCLPLLGSNYVIKITIMIMSLESNV